MPRTLLLADDSVVIQKLVGLSFANEDVELITVDNGNDAIDRARAARPDLILADVVMPGKSGYDVCEAIKSTPELAHTPVLLLTGTFEAFDEVRAAQVGSDGHITKPFEAQALVERVKAVLARAPARPVDTTEPPELSIGNGDSFDFFDERPEEFGGDRTHSIGRQPEPIGELTLEPSDQVGPATRPRAAASHTAPRSAHSPLARTSTDPGATMLVDQLFEDGDEFSDGPLSPTRVRDARSAADPDSSIPDIAPPSAAEAEMRPPDLADIDLFGDDPPGHEDVLDTGNDTGPLDLDLEIGFGATLEEAIRSEGSAQTQPDATVAVLAQPSSRPQYEHSRPQHEDSRAPFEDSRPQLGDAPARATHLVADDRFDISSSDLDDAMTIRSPGVTPAQPVAASRTKAAVPGALTPAEDDEPIAIVQPIDEPFSAPEPVAISAAPQAPPPPPSTAPLSTTPASISAALPAAPSTQALATDVPVTSVPISDEMRRTIHEALEKVAWEAFSDVSQTIVRQTLEQVEKIAWEVIPQMAERLIQEEIRRLKNGS